MGRGAIDLWVNVTMGAQREPSRASRQGPSVGPHAATLDDESGQWTFRFAPFVSSPQRSQRPQRFDEESRSDVLSAGPRAEERGGVQRFHLPHSAEPRRAPGLRDLASVFGRRLSASSVISCFNAVAILGNPVLLPANDVIRDGLD